MLRLCAAYNISCDYLLTGKTSDKDVLFIDEKIKELSPENFNHFKEITEHFLAAVLDKKENKIVSEKLLSV